MSYPFYPCYHYSFGHNLPLSRIVIHGTVSPTRAGQARATGSYFQNLSSGGSAQYVVDPAEVVKCASDDTICWHAPPNQHSIGVEFTDWVYWQQGNGQTVADLDSFWAGKTEADFNARWSLTAWDEMLRLGAFLICKLAGEYAVPLTRIGVADLLAGKHGLCGHVDVSNAWHQSDHTDPGPSFPWDRFMQYVLVTAGRGYVPPVKPPILPLPVAGRLAVDGGLGPATIRRWQQVVRTPVDGVISHPSSLVAAVQKRLNVGLVTKLVVDGEGIVQDGRVYKTVAGLQRYLDNPVDGVLSVPSSLAIKTLQGGLNANKF